MGISGINMSKTFYERLRGYYLEVGKVLRGESSSASIFPNSTDIGMSREKIYAEVLRLHLPSSCNVLYGGFLFGIDGNESKQIDIIITNDLNLQFNFHNKDGGGKSFACVDGTIAVVSVKSHLTSKELIDSLENLSSIPEKTPLEQARPSSIHFFTGYENWPYKIVYASNGIGLETLLNTLN
ncbi:MAG TPA: DUF6602 domain-containing protein, partial [Pyrinomonadaceae bacterium]|nr:DUF6602 domain-containing protein [Pyrinomonadaceae bacterium]